MSIFESKYWSVIQGIHFVSFRVELPTPSTEMTNRIFAKIQKMSMQTDAHVTIVQIHILDKHGGDQRKDVDRSKFHEFENNLWRNIDIYTKVCSLKDMGVLGNKKHLFTRSTNDRCANEDVHKNSIFHVEDQLLILY